MLLTELLFQITIKLSPPPCDCIAAQVRKEASATPETPIGHHHLYSKVSFARVGINSTLRRTASQEDLEDFISQPLLRERVTTGNDKTTFLIGEMSQTLILERLSIEYFLNSILVISARLLDTPLLEILGERKMIGPTEEGEGADSIRSRSTLPG